MIRPALQDDAFLADVEAAGEDPEALFAWWLGQSGFLLRHGDRFLLLDPYLSDSLTHKYADTDRPHVRLTERVVAPERLGFVDVVVSTHDHTDHLDGETLGPLLEANPDVVVVVPEANRGFAARRLDVPPERLTGCDDGVTVEARGIELTGIPAAHERLERDARGRCRYLGYLARLGPFRVYHSGDTLRWDGLARRVRQDAPDLALLPINGSDPARGVAGNLDGDAAARLARDAGARLAVPCHYEMFAFNTASPDAFVETCESLGQAYRVLRAGERLRLEPRS